MFAANYAEKTTGPRQMKVHRVWGSMFQDSEDDGEVMSVFDAHTIVFFPSQMHTSEYPQLSKMVINYLAIQGSATLVECVWSSAGETDTKRCNRLSPTCLEALQFLKAGYRRCQEQRMTSHERTTVQHLLLIWIDNGMAEDDVLCDADLYFLEENHLSELED
ncbi:hypothetical protein FRC01_006841 [Tulasnella sp. 417]|nr:hypothetical protein FRC01_006841 [Tulasnella sp. 417]